MSPQYKSAIMESIGKNPFFGVTLIDNHGVIIFRNKGMERISGITCENPTGKKFKDISSDSTILEVLKTGNPKMGCLYRTPEGKHAIVHRVPLFNDKVIIGALSLAVFDETSTLNEILKRCNFLEGKIKNIEQELNGLKSPKFNFSHIIGESKAITDLKKLSLVYAEKDSNLIILGESGTGKEIFTHAIHNASRRNNGPFISVNCACIPGGLLESELFGYEGGSFSGSRREGKPGKFELAENGTIFLDEIGDLPLDIQPKLLRVIENRLVERVGGIKPRYINFRLITATNKNLKELVNKGSFRDDLYYRLNILSLYIPPLRERKEDIPLLAQFLITALNYESGSNFLLDSGCIEFLLKHDWPGNVRELRNVLEKASTMAENNIISPLNVFNCLNRDLSLKSNNSTPLKSIRKIDKNILRTTLAETKGNKAKAAKILGISRTSLYKKLIRFKYSD